MRDQHTKDTAVNKFVEFWAVIWEDESETPNKKWMDKIKESMKDKIRQEEELSLNKNWERPLERGKTGQNRE